jgi:S1-C subfamily serine protease
MAAHMESVILIEVTAVSPNFIQPWKMHGQRQSSGSGFIISGRRIITNHHVVKDAIDVRLRKHGVARRWRGKVVVSAHDVSARTCCPRHWLGLGLGLGLLPG